VSSSAARRPTTAPSAPSGRAGPASRPDTGGAGSIEAYVLQRRAPEDYILHGAEKERGGNALRRRERRAALVRALPLDARKRDFARLAHGALGVRAEAAQDG
jgi:hypothetical protein